MTSSISEENNCCPKFFSNIFGSNKIVTIMDDPNVNSEKKIIKILVLGPGNLILNVFEVFQILYIFLKEIVVRAQFLNK